MSNFWAEGNPSPFIHKEERSLSFGLSPFRDLALRLLKHYRPRRKRRGAPPSRVRPRLPHSWPSHPKGRIPALGGHLSLSQVRGSPAAPGSNNPQPPPTPGRRAAGRAPAGPSSCRNPPKLTVFLQRARHGEVTSRDPAFGKVNPWVAGPFRPHGSAPREPAEDTPLCSGPAPVVERRRTPAEWPPAGGVGASRSLGRGLLERASFRAVDPGLGLSMERVKTPGNTAGKLLVRGFG